MALRSLYSRHCQWSRRTNCFWDQAIRYLLYSPSLRQSDRMNAGPHVDPINMGTTPGHHRAHTVPTPVFLPWTCNPPRADQFHRPQSIFSDAIAR